MKLAAGFTALVIVLCGVAAPRAFVLSRASRVMSDTAEIYMPEMQLATAFEREILNARIHFIYHVTVQKPGALEAGWVRFGKARALLPKMKQTADSPKLLALRQPTNQLIADLD